MDNMTQAHAGATPSSLAFAPARSSVVARARGTSLHRQLFVVLRDEIIRGVYVSGALPIEEAMCERFGVSRVTVRRALAELASLGLVERHAGRGTFVRADLSQIRELPSLTLIENLRKSAMEMEAQVLEVTRSDAPRDVALLLQLEPAEKALHVVRLRSINGTPVMLTDSWVAAKLGRKVTEKALRKRALLDLLKDRGVKFGRVVQQITAEAADPARSQLLQTEVGSPLLKLVRLLHDLQSRPVQQLTAWLTPERSCLLMEIPGETVNTFSAGQFVHHVHATAAMRGEGAAR